MEFNTVKLQKGTMSRMLPFFAQTSKITDIPRATIYSNYAGKTDGIPDMLVIGKNNEVLFVGALSEEISKLLKPRKNDTMAKAESKRFLSFLGTFKKEVIAQALHAQTGIRTSLQFRHHSLCLQGALMHGISQDNTSTMVMVEIRCQKRLRENDRNSRGTFTPRETNILHYIRAGLTNKEIANALGIGLYTVKAHVKNIMNKTDIHTRSGIAGKYLTV